jgi:hypothetical protein
MCMSYCASQVAGAPCHIYGLSVDTTSICINSYEPNGTPTFDEVVIRNPDGQFVFNDISCPVPTFV